VGGGTTCKYNPEWCGNITIANVNTGTVPASQNSSPTGNCYFVKNITATQNIYGGASVNGVNWNDNKYQGNVTSLLPESADGGYYIYIPGWAMFDATITEATEISPNCN
jgi:hypothetical protein